MCLKKNLNAPRSSERFCYYRLSGLRTTVSVTVSKIIYIFSFSSHLLFIAVFSLYGEYVVRSFLPDGVFLPCDPGLDF